MNIQFSPVRLRSNQQIARPSFGNEEKAPKELVDYSQKPQENVKKKDEYVDPLLKWPARGLGYTNDLGVAISEVAPKLSLFCWVPALMYFGADIYDKYKNKGDEYKPDGQRALSQAVFQAVASVAFPFVVGHIGSSVFSSADRIRGEKLSSNAKEQALDDLKAFVNKNDIYAVDADENALVNKFKQEFETSYMNKKNSYENKGFFGKVFDYLLCGCKEGAMPNADKDKLTDYAINSFKKLKSQRTGVEELTKLIEKEAFKHKVWKSIGSFAALLSTVSVIDKFTENVIIHKCVEPGLETYNQHAHKKAEHTPSKEVEKKSA